jgi:1-acyl-sn-glycerol-3-phosphate acyltransferase
MSTNATERWARLRSEAGWLVINVAQALFLATLTTVCFPFTVAFLFLTGGRRWSLDVARRVWAPLLVKYSGARVAVEGSEHLPPKGQPYIVMMNHQSILDIIVAFTIIPTGIRFVAKKSIGYVPILGWYMWLMGMVFIDRENHSDAVSALRKAAQLIRSGAVIFTFPEGTRTKDGTVGPFKKGIFMLAIEAGVPIVPVAIEGCLNVSPNHTWRIRPGDVRVKIGAPIPTSGVAFAQRDELIHVVRNRIIDLHKDVGGKGGDPERAISGRVPRPQPAAQPLVARL